MGKKTFFLFGTIALLGISLFGVFLIVTEENPEPFIWITIWTTFNAILFGIMEWINRNKK